MTSLSQYYYCTLIRMVFPIQYIYLVNKCYLIPLNFPFLYKLSLHFYQKVCLITNC